MRMLNLLPILSRFSQYARLADTRTHGSTSGHACVPACVDVFAFLGGGTVRDTPFFSEKQSLEKEAYSVFLSVHALSHSGLCSCNVKTNVQI